MALFLRSSRLTWHSHSPTPQPLPSTLLLIRPNECRYYGQDSICPCSTCSEGHAFDASIQRKCSHVRLRCSNIFEDQTEDDIEASPAADTSQKDSLDTPCSVAGMAHTLPCQAICSCMAAADRSKHVKLCAFVKEHQIGIISSHPHSIPSDQPYGCQG